MPRSDKGTIQLTERDQQLIRWIVEQYAIPLDQLAQLIGATEHAARRIMQRWKKAGWAEGRVLIAREKPWIWITRRGQADMGIEFRHWEPTLAKLEHIRAVNAVRMSVQHRRPDGVWINERALLQRQASDQRMARERGIEPPKIQHLPDGVWQIDANAEQTAVEVERSYKGTERTRMIMLHLLQVQRYPKVAYFTTPTIRPHLDAITAGHPDLAARIRVYLIPEGAAHE